MEDTVGVAEFFAGRYVLVTGATGFMGKVLVEKLVRSCPDIAGVYILVRGKRDEDPQRRLDKIIGLPLFDLVREEARRKVIVVPGDLKLKRLGLTDAWAEELKQRVSIVFHSAATVRFADPLKESVILNTRGTSELVELAAQMPKLAVFLHVSTTYCNVDREVIEEKVYPAHAEWRDTVRVVEQADERALRILTAKYIGGARGLPNTYCFAKSLAEHVIKDAEERLPVIIFRPSIVISTDSEPVAGWVDNFNGPVALLVGAAKGVIHITLADSNIVADYIPVDVAIKAIIVAVWRKGIATEEEKKRVTVYNAASSSTTPILMGEMVKMGLDILETTPVGKTVWPPSGIVTPHFWLYYVGFLLMHVLPAIFADVALSIAGQKFRLMRLHRKLYTTNTALSYFTTRTWRFANNKILKLDEEIPLRDRKDFSYAIVDRKPLDFFLKATLGGRRYLLKESDDNLEADRRHYARVLFISRIVKFCFYSFLVYLVLCSSFVQVPLAAITDVFESP